MKSTQRLIALTVFGLSFGYVEAAVVVYLRAVEEPVRRAVFGGRLEDEVFPLLTLDDLKAAGPEYVPILATELGRELATLLLLGSAALAFSRNFQQWLAGFMIAFGLWDIFYYAFLKLLIDWPRSLWAWDILFLIPVPWVGPVIAPVLVSAAMILAGTAILRREAAGQPIAFRWFHWAAIFGGGLTLVVAFCWDYQAALSGAWPNPFNWPLFAAGLVVGLAGFVHALGTSPRTVSRRPADSPDLSGSA